MLGMISVSLLMNSSTSLAWSNGKRNVCSPRNPSSQYIGVYKTDYTKIISSNTRREYYGAHDWVAETALELLYSVRTSHPFLEKLWDINNPDLLRIWFLIGTEIPDTGKYISDLRTSCGKTFTIAEVFHQYHRVLRFEELYGFPTDDEAARTAEIYYGDILKAFREKDCQAAALFIGALLHVITDAAFYGHVIDTGMSGHTTFMAHIDHICYRTWADVSGDRASEFFNIDEASNRVTASSLNSPYLATLLCGRDTFLGDVYGTPTIRDATWLYSKQPSPVDHQHWDDVNGPWTINSDLLTWTHSMRPNDPLNPDPRDYFNTLEHNLNMAIYYCVSVLNYIITYGGYIDCECTGENPPSDPIVDPPGGGDVRDPIRVGIQTTLDEFQALFFLGAVGLASTMISLTLVNKLIDIIDKMILV